MTLSHQVIQEVEQQVAQLKENYKQRFNQFQSEQTQTVAQYEQDQMARLAQDKQQQLAEKEHVLANVAQTLATEKSAEIATIDALVAEKEEQVIAAIVSEVIKQYGSI